MVILVVILLVLWAILAVLGFAFEGLLWVAIIAIILFIGTIAVALVRRNTVVKRRKGAAAMDESSRKAPTVAAQRDEIVTDDQVNPTGNLE